MTDATAEPPGPTPPGRVIVLTDRRQCEARGRSLPDTVAATADAGAPAVLFREKDLAPAARRSLADEIAAALSGTSTRLVVASDADLALEVGAVGVHLAGEDPTPPAADASGTGGTLAFSRSCHDAREVAAASAEGAAWVTLSPIFDTPSKPGYGPALGTQALAGHHVPVFALGGVGAATVEACIAGGAHGVAVMGYVMSAPDPAAAVRDLLAGLP